jgi:hypothetical protein
MKSKSSWGIKNNIAAQHRHASDWHSASRQQVKPAVLPSSIEVMQFNRLPALYLLGDKQGEKFGEIAHACKGQKTLQRLLKCKTTDVRRAATTTNLPYIHSGLRIAKSEMNLF